MYTLIVCVCVHIHTYHGNGLYSSGLLRETGLVATTRSNKDYSWFLNSLFKAQCLKYGDFVQLGAVKPKDKALLPYLQKSGEKMKIHSALKAHQKPTAVGQTADPKCERDGCVQGAKECHFSLFY